MIGLGIGLMFGIGLFCLWWACWPAPARVARRPRPPSRLSEDLLHAGLPGVRVRSLLGLCAGCAIVVFVVVSALTGVLPIAGCFAAMAGTAPLALVRGRARRRRGELRHLWPDVVDHVTSAVRAGMSLPEALGHLATRGPQGLRAPFAEFAHDYRATGRFNDALDDLKHRLADPVADRIVESLRLTREVGGNDLVRVLNSLSAFLRQDARIRSELEARQSWTVNAARLAVAAPWVVVAMLSTRPESVAAYSRPAGVVVLLGGAALTACSYLMMLRVARLPEEQRVLR